MAKADKMLHGMVRAGLNHSKRQVRLYSRGHRGQHKAVEETISRLKLMASGVSVKYLSNFNCDAVRSGDDYTLTIEYDGLYNSQAFVTELWNRLDLYYTIKNV